MVNKDLQRSDHRNLLINLRKGSNLCSLYPALHLPAVTARLSEGEELPLF